MALRNIVQVEDPILRKKCKPVEKVDDKIRDLLSDMAETMYHAPGRGLAACQVGILRRLVVIDMGQGDGLMKLVNPRITHTKGEQEVIEGCLSIPGKAGWLLRPFEVTVEALDENGDPVTLTGTGDLAKCFCHELDHLDGVLYSDKVIRWEE